MVGATHQTWLGAGRYCSQFASAALVAAVVAPHGYCGRSSSRRRWTRRLAAASLLVGPALTTWWSRRPALDPLRFVLGQLADGIAYGSGVWFGCVRSRTVIPVRPVISFVPPRKSHAGPGDDHDALEAHRSGRLRPLR
jgi:hypothetical protein